MKNIPVLQLMKFTVFIFLYFISQISISQELFKSPITQHFPSGEIVRIERTILFTKDSVFIHSETPYGLQIKKYVVNDYSVHTFPVNGLSEFFVCSSLDNIYTTYFQIPILEKVIFIEMVEPRQFYRKQGRFRFLID